MATRMDIELTSRRDDATFTWRAAGAREPKGVAEASLFPADATVGAEFKVEAEVEMDGITITAVIPPKQAKSNPFEVLELIGGADEPLVTQQLARKPRGDRKDRGKGKGRGKGRRDGDRGERGGDNRDRRPAKPKLPPKPKAPRLRAGRAHRNALLDGLPEEQKPVAQELLGGGLQAVRTALAKQNESLAAEGKPTIDEGPMLTLAEGLLSQLRTAEWRDRADAALEQADTVDIRDLRSVVTAGQNAARDDEARALATRLQDALNNRLDAEQRDWVAEIVELLDDERVVRALHRSSRPPKAGAPLPAEVALRLVEATNAALTAETSPDRWGYTIEALAHSPIRGQVVPAGLPSELTDELRSVISRFGTRLPHIAEIFGITPDPKAGKGQRRRKPRSDKAKAKAKPVAGDADPGDNQQSDVDTTDTSDASEAPTPAEPVEAAAPAADTDVATEPAPEAETPAIDADPEADAPANDDAAEAGDATETDASESDASEAPTPSDADTDN